MSNKFSNDGSFMEQFLKATASGSGQSMMAQPPSTAAADTSAASFAQQAPPSYPQQAVGQANSQVQLPPGAGMANAQLTQGVAMSPQQMAQAYQTYYQYPYTTYAAYTGYGLTPVGQASGTTYGGFSGGVEGQPCRTVWVGNLHPATTEMDLRNELAEFGMIENVKVCCSF